MKDSANDNFKLLSELSPVDTTSLADKVELKLIRFFLDNNLQPGDNIPKELDLAVTLGVSRTVIREVLLRLRMVGLITSGKRKKGSVLSNPDLLSLFQKTLYPTMLDQKTLRDMFEMRLVLEIGLADLIFYRKTKKDVGELEQIVKNEPDKSSDYLFDVPHEIAFHSKLYEMTGNDTLKRFQQMLLPLFQYVNENGLLKKSIKVKRYISHKKLVDIIKTGTPDQFREAMRKHLENHFKRLF